MRGSLSNCNAAELHRTMCGTSSTQRGRAYETERLVTVLAVRDVEEIVDTGKKLLEFDSEVEISSRR